MNLSKKLQVKDPLNFFVVNGAGELLDSLVQEGLQPLSALGDYHSGGVLLFVQDSQELNSVIEKLISDESSDNHWVAFPKKHSRIQTDLGRDHGWEQLLEKNWLPVRQISLSDQWSALRFRPRGKIKELKRGTDYPGIDSQKKTVEIPVILSKRLKEHGLQKAFDALNFTKRKEAAISILEAKKPETLERRINKILTEIV